MRSASAAFFVFLLFILTGAENSLDTGDRSRHVTFYNSYAYLDGDEWVIPARVWVHQDRSWLESLSSWTVRIMGEYSPDEMEVYRRRMTDLLADSKWRRTVSIMFEGDPEEHVYRIKNSEGEAPRTDRNGIIEGKIRVPVENAVWMHGHDEDKKVRIHARSNRYRGGGYVRFMQPNGLSVISDIDDTIKVTEIPAGSRIVVRNTFFREYSAAPGMASMYEQWPEASFHYVSGSPWQLYRSLSGFLFGEEAGFPVGTFHMKNARKNLFTVSSWTDLVEFITNEHLTFEQKIGQITRIFEHFPDRRFIMVGDSGERDPEVYRTIRQRFPDQVKEIIIRDVINDRELRPERLDGMTIEPAPTIRPGISIKNGGV